MTSFPDVTSKYRAEPYAIAGRRAYSSVSVAPPPCNEKNSLFVLSFFVSAAFSTDCFFPHPNKVITQRHTRTSAFTVFFSILILKSPFKNHFSCLVQYSAICRFSSSTNSLFSTVRHPFNIATASQLSTSTSLLFSLRNIREIAFEVSLHIPLPLVMISSTPEHTFLISFAPLLRSYNLRDGDAVPLYLIYTP